MIEVPQSVKDQTDWIPLKRYMEWYGETKDAIVKRIKTGVWAAGVQWSRPEGAGIWVSQKGVNEWAARHQQTP